MTIVERTTTTTTKTVKTVPIKDTLFSKCYTTVKNILTDGEGIRHSTVSLSYDLVLNSDIEKNIFKSSIVSKAHPDYDCVPVAIKNSDMADILAGHGSIFESSKIKRLSIENIDNPDYFLCFFCISDYTLWDLNLNIISLPVCLNYLNSINNRNYNLKAVLEVLKKNKYVLDRENLKISDIPWYNCEQNRNEQISFKVLVPSEIYMKYKTSNCSSSVETIFKFLNILKFKKLE